MNDFAAAAHRIWLITGCSGGLGKALAEAVIGRGDFAVVTARRIETLEPLRQMAPERCLPLALDVNDNAAIKSVVERAIAWQGKLDFLVNNAGYGMVGAVEEVSDAEARAIFDTNVFGLLDVVRAVLPQMRAQRAGCVINISSMGGLTGFGGMGLYSATKFAVEGLSEAMALELRPLGIHVMAVEPGPFRTGFRSGLAHAQQEIADYVDTAGKMRKVVADSEVSKRLPGDPRLGAQVIVAAALSEQPPLHLPLGKPCYDGVRNKMNKLAEEMARWESQAVATAFAE